MMIGEDLKKPKVFSFNQGNLEQKQMIQEQYYQMMKNKDMEDSQHYLPIHEIDEDNEM